MLTKISSRDASAHLPWSLGRLGRLGAELFYRPHPDLFSSLPTPGRFPTGRTEQIDGASSYKQREGYTGPEGEDGTPVAIPSARMRRLVPRGRPAASGLAFHYLKLPQLTAPHLSDE
jgi:hypothetical protein